MARWVSWDDRGCSSQNSAFDLAEIILARPLSETELLTTQNWPTSRSYNNKMTFLLSKTSCLRSLQRLSKLQTLKTPQISSARCLQHYPINDDFFGLPEEQQQVGLLCKLVNLQHGVSIWFWACTIEWQCRIVDFGIKDQWRNWGGGWPLKWYLCPSIDP